MEKKAHSLRSKHGCRPALLLPLLPTTEQREAMKVSPSAAGRQTKAKGDTFLPGPLCLIVAATHTCLPRILIMIKWRAGGGGRKRQRVGLIPSRLATLYWPVICIRPSPQSAKRSREARGQQRGQPKSTYKTSPLYWRLLCIDNVHWKCACQASKRNKANETQQVAARSQSAAHSTRSSGRPP